MSDQQHCPFNKANLDGTRLLSVMTVRGTLYLLHFALRSAKAANLGETIV